MKSALLALLLVAACGGSKTPAPAPAVGNETHAETAAAPPDAAPSCPDSCSIDEVGCLLSEQPPACCYYYKNECKAQRQP